MTLITAQPQPNIPLSLVIHLCLLSLTDKTMQNSRQLKSCTISNGKALFLVLIGISLVLLYLAMFSEQ